MCTLDEGVLEEGDKETLLLTVEALKAQLEEQTRLCKEQVILTVRCHKDFNNRSYFFRWMLFLKIEELGWKRPML